MTNRKYLELQYNTWSVTLKIPSDVQDFFGKTKFMKSLATSSLEQANLWKWKFIEDWKVQIQIARKTKNQNQSSSKEDLVNSYKLEIATKWKGYEKEALLELGEGLWENAKTSEQRIDAEEIYMRTSGEWTSTSQYIEEFLRQHDYTPKTNDEARSALNHCTKRFGVFEKISEYEMMLYINSLLQTDDNSVGLTIRTVKKRIGFFRTYWDYCLRNRYTSYRHNAVLTPEIYPQNNKTKASTSRKVKSKRKPFSISDYHLLLNSKSDDQTLCDLIRLAAHTGCRREELCSMKLENVKSDRLIVEDAKTPSGWREIPIHSDIKQLVERLIQTSNDGYLLSGLSDNNKYQKRGEAIGKRFLNLRKKLGFGSRYVLHSFRNTLITQMLNNGVPVAHTALIVGHGEMGFSFDAYAGDIAWSEKVKHIEACSYRED